MKPFKSHNVPHQLICFIYAIKFVFVLAFFKNIFFKCARCFIYSMWEFQSVELVISIQKLKSLSLSLSLSQQRKTKTKRPTNLNLKSCFLYSLLKFLPLFILKHKTVISLSFFVGMLGTFFYDQAFPSGLALKSMFRICVKLLSLGLVLYL